MLSAEERVVELLRTFNEARMAYGRGSTGNGVVLMPSMWHEGSYAELERRLIQMRESRQRPLWWHVSHRYRFGVECTIIVTVLRTQKGAEYVVPRYCELVAGGPSVGEKKALARVYRWSHLVDSKKVGQGVGALVRTMYDGRYDRIVLPQLVLDRVLGLPAMPEKVAG